MSVRGIGIRQDQENTNRSADKSAVQGASVRRKGGTATIYAGNLNLADNKTDQTMLQAKKKAMKTIMDQFKNERKIDDGVTKVKEKQEELKADMERAGVAVKDLRARKKDLMEEYKITEDSEENTDLNLLEKSIYSDQELTTQEQERLKNMGPLTEYQKNALKNDAMEQIWLRRIEDAQNGISNGTKTITGIQLERVKTHPMVDAQIEAVKIIEEASDQVVNQLVQEAKEKFDEEQQKNREEVKKEQEKNQQEEEQLLKKRVEREAVEKVNQEGSTQQGSMLSVAATAASEVSAVQQINNMTMTNTDLIALELQSNLKNFAKKQNLLPEDLLGIAVDETV